MRSRLTPNPDVADCPVKPIGYDGRYIVFLMPEGNRRTVAAAQVARYLESDIFACEAGQTFLTHWQDEDSIDRQAAARWLIRACRAAGYYDTLFAATDGSGIGGIGSLNGRSDHLAIVRDPVVQPVKQGAVADVGGRAADGAQQGVEIDRAVGLGALRGDPKQKVEQVDLVGLSGDHGLQRRDPLLVRLFHCLTSLLTRVRSSTESVPARKSEAGQ